MLVTFTTVVHVLVCVFLILVILLQAGKDAGMGASFGGGGSGSVFGGRGAGSFLGKLTATAATIFFITSLSLSFAASYNPSVTRLLDASAPAAAPANAAPAPSEAVVPGAPAPGEGQPAQLPAIPDAPATPVQEAPAQPAAPQ